MRISATHGTAIDPERGHHSAHAQVKAEAEAPASDSALVSVAVDRRFSERSASSRPLATLLAQLMANAQNFPTTRARRRADPGEGARIYRAAASLDAAPRPHTRRVV
jgi:hypothetical protein